MKENNGKARKERLKQRLMFIGAVVGVGLVFMAALRQGKTRLRRHQLRALSSASTLQLEDILSGKLSLMDLDIDESRLVFRANSDYTGINARFCKVDWDLYRKDPSATAMYRILVHHSGCHAQDHIISVDLKDLADKAREYDRRVGTTSVLNLTGVAFHESRCGSTLVANMLAAMSSHNRVYSEAAGPIIAMNVCGNNYDRCSFAQATQILQDTVYLMSRSDSTNENRVFFKIQSAGTHKMSLFTKAFPDVPLMFVYRDPVEVLMSHLKGGKNANCLRRAPILNENLEMTLQEHHKTMETLTDEEYCAVHVASIVESALEHLQSPHLTPINYADLPQAVYDVVQYRWGLPLTDAERDNMQRASTSYSKGKGGPQQGQEYRDDSAKKQADASATVQAAAETYLSASFETLEMVGRDMRQEEKALRHEHAAT